LTAIDMEDFTVGPPADAPDPKKIPPAGSGQPGDKGGQTNGAHNTNGVVPFVPVKQHKSILQNLKRAENHVDGLARAFQEDKADLPLVFAEDILAAKINLIQMVEDVLIRGGLTVMYGESNSGKSFLATHLACCIGRGIPWLGKRCERGSVMYVAGEGSESIKMRILAYRQYYKTDDLNVAVVPVSINMMDKNEDSEKVIRAAKSIEDHYRYPVSMIIIDTLARAFGSGSENASEDMGAVIQHADMIRARTGAHVLFIHHSGKDAAKGSRGHSSLRAATDTEIEVTSAEDKLHTAEVKKQRDLGSLGEKLTGKFQVVRMGEDQWGKPATTCVVTDTLEIPVSKKIATGLKRDGALALSITAMLRDQDLYVAKSEIARRLYPLGYSRSSVYNSIANLLSVKMLLESARAVKLNPEMHK
jgi:putative DNA primase/helicase